MFNFITNTFISFFSVPIILLNSVNYSLSTSSRNYFFLTISVGGAKNGAVWVRDGKIEGQEVAREEEKVFSNLKSSCPIVQLQRAKNPTVQTHENTNS